MTQTAKLYGDSLYDLAAEEQVAETVFEQIHVISRIFCDNPDYIRLLSDPSLPMRDRLNLLDEAFSGKIERYLLNFLKILCEKALLSEYAGCCREYQKRYYADKGMVPAVVTSAVALTQAQARKLTSKLEQYCGKQVILEEKVNPALLGGLKIELDGKRIDGTVAGRLAEMQKAIKEVNY